MLADQCETNVRGTGFRCDGVIIVCELFQDFFVTGEM